MARLCCTYNLPSPSPSPQRRLPPWLYAPRQPAGMSSRGGNTTFSLLATNAARSLDPTGTDSSKHATAAPPAEGGSGTQSSFVAGIPRWVELPGTVAGGAWMLPLTGVTGTTVLAPVAPGAPRVQKLAPGSEMELSGAEVAAVIEEYKRARRMAKKHGGSTGGPTKPGCVVKPTDVAAARAAASAAVHAPLPEVGGDGRLAAGGGGPSGIGAVTAVWGSAPHGPPPHPPPRTPAAEAASQAAAVALGRVAAARQPGSVVARSGQVGGSSELPHLPPLPPLPPLQVRVQPPGDHTVALDPGQQSPMVGVPSRNPYSGSSGGSPTGTASPQAGVPSLRCTRPPPGFEMQGGTPRGSTQTSPKEWSPTAGERGPPPGFAPLPSSGPMFAECRPQEQPQQAGGVWSCSTDVFAGVR